MRVKVIPALQYVSNVIWCRSRGSTGKGKDSEYENMESDNGEDSEAGQQPPLAGGRDSEQREIDEFEEEERRLLAEEAKVGGLTAFSLCVRFLINFFKL